MEGGWRREEEEEKEEEEEEKLCTYKYCTVCEG